MMIVTTMRDIFPDVLFRSGIEQDFVAMQLSHIVLHRRINTLFLVQSNMPDSCNCYVVRLATRGDFGCSRHTRVFLAKV